MTEKEITQTVTVEEERSETITVCDGCGIEVEPGENCRSLTDGDENNVLDTSMTMYSERFTPMDQEKIIEKWGEDTFVEEFLYLPMSTYMSVSDDFSGGVVVPVSEVTDTSDNTFHYCFDCWEALNTSVDEKSLNMAQTYEEKVMERAEEKAQENLLAGDLQSLVSSLDSIEIGFVLWIAAMFVIAFVLSDVIFALGAFGFALLLVFIELAAFNQNMD